jgi:hypothetical protein
MSRQFKEIGFPFWKQAIEAIKQKSYKKIA